MKIPYSVYSYFPELDYHFSKYITEVAVLNYEGIRLPESSVALHCLRDASIFKLIFDEQYQFNYVNYYFNLITKDYLPTALQTRMYTLAAPTNIWTTKTPHSFKNQSYGSGTFVINLSYKDKFYQNLNFKLPKGSTVYKTKIKIKSPCFPSHDQKKEIYLKVGSKDDLNILIDQDYIDLFSTSEYEIINNYILNDDIDFHLQLDIKNGLIGNFECEINIEYNKEEVKQHDEYLTNNLISNALNLTKNDIILLNKLLEFRLGILDKFTYKPENYIDDNVAYLLCVYLQAAVNKNYIYCRDDKIISNSKNIFETCLEFYVTDACCRLLEKESKIDVKYSHQFLYRELFTVKKLHSPVYLLTYSIIDDQVNVWQNGYLIEKDLYTITHDKKAVILNNSIKLSTEDILIIDYITDISGEDRTKCHIFRGSFTKDDIIDDHLIITHNFNLDAQNPNVIFRLYDDNKYELIYTDIVSLSSNEVVLDFTNLPEVNNTWYYIVAG